MPKRKRLEEGGDPPHPPKKRGKSQEQKDHDSKHQHTPVQCKLNTILSQADPELSLALHSLLNDCSYNISRIAHEAYMLANMHVIRCIEENVDLPELNQSFFKSCCTLVSKTKVGVDSEQLTITMEQYRLLRPEGFNVPENEHMGPLMGSLSREMKTAASNHIVLNLFGRLTKYVRLKYGYNKAISKEFIHSAFKDTAICDEQKEFKEWLGVSPFYEDVIKSNLNHFVRKLRDVQLFMEAQERAKGSRTFTLLPTKSGFVGSFILIDQTTLPVILSLLSRDHQERIVCALMSQCAENDDNWVFLHSRLTSRAVFCAEFQQRTEISHALWHLLFHTSHLETANRKFRYQLSTDGYAVTVSMEKPKQTEDVPEYDRLPRDLSSFERYVGVDPGSTYVATAMDDQNKFAQVSTKEYRHLAKMDKQRQWHDRLRKREAEYGSVLAALPSLKTGSLEKFKEAVRGTLLHSEFLCGFSKEKAFRKWRFKVTVFGKKALVECVRRVTGKGGRKKVLVGFGDWTPVDGFLKGNDKAPLLKFRREMRNHATVVEINEFRTSVTCSKCYCTTKMKNVSYVVGGKSVPCHQVVHCQNSECNTVWQRDVNASRNMLAVLLSRVRGEERHPSLCRQSP